MPRRHTLAWLAGAALVLSGCGGASSSPQDPPPTPEPGAAAIRMAAVGDSITDADSPDFGGGEPGPQSWVSYAVGEDVEFVGGWAVWGASTAQMAQEVEALDADVLVILAGTNDAGTMPHPEITANITTIAEQAGVDDVVLSAVPPIDAAPASATELNESLADLARAQDWTWVDTPAGLRAGEQFADGMADDGLHPNEEGAQVLGEGIGEAVRAAGR